MVPVDFGKPVTKELKVAFPYIDRQLWQGGYNYLLNLLGSLELAEDTETLAIVYAGRDIPDADLNPFRQLSNTSVRQHPHFSRSNMLYRQAKSLMRGRDIAAEEIYSVDEVQGVFENAFFHGAKTSFPVLAWIPDFQHRHLPDLFPARRYWKRDIGFRMQLKHRDHVLLSSQDANDDLTRFYPSHNVQSHVLRFCAALPDFLGDLDLNAVQDSYNLPESFIYLPNQFYFHKNHSVVVESLSHARQLGHTPTVVASGSIDGPRHCNSVHAVRQLLRKHELESNFLILGSIPYRDVPDHHAESMRQN